MAIKIAECMDLVFCPCGCGGIRLELLDSEGKVFAAAELDQEDAEDFAISILGADDDDEIQEVAGHC